MLASALSQQRHQQRITALGLRQTRRVATRGAVAVARVLSAYQAASITLAIASADEVLAEQGIDTTATGTPVAAAMLTGRGAAALLGKASTRMAFDRLVLTLIADAGRTATVVTMATRPAVTGYVRRITVPCCGRCAVLAGRVYRFSEGFLRHPQCDCDPTPTDIAAGRELVTDTSDLVDRGLITGLSKGDAEALAGGADLGQVVNVRRKSAGLTVGSSVIERAGRPTPQGILQLVSDRAEMIELLRRFGYIT